MNENLIYLRGKLITQEEAKQYLTPHNRRELLDWISVEICPKLELTQQLDIKTIIDVVTKFRVKNSWNIHTPMHATLNEYGHLFINGIHAGLITNHIPRPRYSEEANILEGKILARTEDYND